MDAVRKALGFPIIGDIVEPALWSQNETYCVHCWKLIAYTKDYSIGTHCCVGCQIKDREDVV